ncbi:MAG: N-acetyltransferase family protein [Chloroflexota bacterium]|nr:GNAT family N-acetyltransferase [Anaerolineales bacterium]
MDSVELRPVTEEDESFLAEVYASCRRAEMALLPWDEAAKQSFLQMQFRAQQTHYQTYFPEASHAVILTDGIPVGRVYVDRRESEIRILDFAVLPERRGQGIGSYTLQNLMKEAQAANKTLSIYVERSSPSLQWFEKRGFVKAGENGFSDLMERQPAKSNVVS